MKKITGMISSSSRFSSGSIQKLQLQSTTMASYIKQRKLKKFLKKRLPSEEIDRAEEHKKNIVSFNKRTPRHPFIPVVISSRIEKTNVKELEDWEKEGYTPGTKISHEESGIKDYIASIEEMKKDDALLKSGGYTPKQRRVGALGVKLGMTRTFDSNGNEIPLSCIYLPRCIVTQQKTIEKDGYNAMQLAAGFKAVCPPSLQEHFKPAMKIFLENRQRALNGDEPLPNTIRAPYQMHYGRKINYYPQAAIEVKVSESAMLPIGTEITVAHFKPGQYVDIKGRTKGKGFAGVMKKWGFSGHPRTHGSNKDHRKPGSLHSGISRVIPGKKMPGRMGFDVKESRSLQVYGIDTERNYIFVKGSIPGAVGRYVSIVDTQTKPQRNKELPYPTQMETLGEPGVHMKDTEIASIQFRI